MPATPPTTDPSLPSYLHPAYLDMQADLQLVWDVWHELKDCKQTYLPKEAKEPPQAYKNRLMRSHFDNRFTPALKGYAGLLTEYGFTDEIAASIELAEQNIDLQGNDLQTFFCNVDELALRDGGCGVLVEYQPEDLSIVSNRDLIESNRRPYLVAIERRNILNWRIEYVNGQPTIAQVTIQHCDRVSDGLFGVRDVTRYRVLTPGYYHVYELIANKGTFTKVLIDEGATSLDEVPLIWYSVSDSTWFEPSPPFLNLARLNIEHLQKRSSLNEVLHKINLPVPVRKGAKPVPGTNPPQMPGLTIGPNSLVDIPETGDFFFAEPTGNAIAATQVDIAKLEASMDRVSLSFLTGGENAKTATEVVLDTAQTQATIKSMARRKESASQRLFGFWAAYTGEPTGGSIDINESVLQVPATPQEVQVILDAMGVQISRELGLRMLLDRRWLPDDTDIEKELNAVEPMPDVSHFSDATTIKGLPEIKVQ